MPQVDGTYSTQAQSWHTSRVTIANNPATALEKILRTLIESRLPTIGQGWTATLGVEPGSPDFAKRHAEVVALFSRVQAHLESLDENARERALYAKYVDRWYNAVVYRESWDARERPAKTAINPEVLDHLAGLGLQLSLQSPEPPLDDEKLRILSESLAAWRDLLDEAGLPEGLVVQIRAQVDHLEWLLANADQFGVPPIAEAARDLLGYSVVVAPRAPKWKLKLGVALYGLVAFLGPVDDATEHAKNAVTNVIETFREVESLFEEPEPQRALESGGQPQIEAANDSAEADDDGDDSPS